MIQFFSAIVGLWIFSIPFKNALFELSSAFLIGSTALVVIANRLQNQVKHIPALPKSLALSFMAAAASLFIANYFGRQMPSGYWVSAHFIVRYGGIFCCLYYLYCQGYLTSKTIFRATALALIAQAGLGMAQLLLHFDIIRDQVVTTGTRIYGGTFNPNPFGLLMAIGASLAFARLVKFSHLELKKFLLCTALLIFFVFCLLLSGSRSSWIAFVVFLFVIALTTGRVFIKRIPIVISTTVGIGLAVFLFHPMTSTNIDRLFLSDSSYRFTIWQTAFKLFQEAPFFGYGFGDFSGLSGLPFASVHNSIIELLLYTGLVGLLCYGFLLANILKLLWQTSSQILFAIFTAMLFASLFDHSLIDSKIFLSCTVVIVAQAAIRWVQIQATAAPTHQQQLPNRE
ncbi:O-antigen ligase family protein [Simiduia curdlanivorans]|uniref:O-antigen ligase family protein n=1 Tax=Simiduia curdlanivorans TaxID=1492769 RepID=A0ABV8V075_9GAMM|nr:O-antigen ligase family protein [Simiduia curdlanivorans]MDN3637923.1 O-antigen ligase family protein [Simiduia curdlanivorans]